MLHAYTIEQVTAFVESARENRSRDTLDIAVSFRAAQTSDKDWKRYIASFAKADGQRKDGTPKVATGEQIAHLRKMSGGKAR